MKIFEVGPFNDFRFLEIIFIDDFFIDKIYSQSKQFHNVIKEYSESSRSMHPAQKQQLSLPRS